MKTLKISMIALLLANATPGLAEITTDGVVQSLSSTTGYDVKKPASAVAKEFAFSYFPSTDNYQINLARISGGIKGFTLGCDGLSWEGLAGSFENQIEQFGAQLRSLNYTGLAINFAAYASPTLHALLQEAKESTEFNLGTSLLTCQGARQLGKKWAENIEANAEAECMAAEGSNDPSCSSNERIGEIVLDKIREKKEDWNEMVTDTKQRLDLDSHLVGDPEGSGLATPTSCDAEGELDGNSSLRVVLNMSSLKCDDKSVAVDVLVDKKLTDDYLANGQKAYETAEPEKNISKYLSDESITTGSAIKNISRQIASGKGEKDIVESDDWKHILDKGYNKLSLSQMTALSNAANGSKLSALEADNLFRLIGTKLAVGKMEQTVLKLETGLITGMTHNGKEKLDDDLIAHYEKEITRLKAEIRLQKETVRIQQEQNQYIDNILKNSKLY